MVPKFWYSWYIVDVMDQNIHANFYGHYNTWIRKTNGYPIPMQENGFGCIQRSRPNKLLEYSSALNNGNPPISFMNEMADFLIDEAKTSLYNMIELLPETFFLTLLLDNEFNNPVNTFETLLAKKINNLYGFKI